MKRFSRILLVAVALFSVTLVSCNKDNSKTEEPEFTAPANAANAKKVVVNSVVPGSTRQVKELEFTEGGYAIITYIKSKADTEEEVEVKTYTYSNGEYTIAGFGSVKIEGNNVTITTPSETITVTATVTDTEAPQEGTVQFNLYRAWTLYDLKVSVSGGDLAAGIGKLFTAPVTMEKIDKWLKEQNVKVPEDIVITDYDIKDINFTKEGTILINFSKADPFKGVFSIGGKTFEYTLNGVGNYIFNGKANGSVDFFREDNVDYCSWVVKGKIENGNKSYNSEIELTLKQK